MRSLSVKAVFLDRDGIVNELVYYPEQGIIDSPFTTQQMKLTPFAVEAVNRLHDLGFKVILISNQPGMAKGHFDEATFDQMRLRMRELLERDGAFLDGEYYCFHHPNGVRENYRKVCDCRKPKPGLLITAAKDLKISLTESFFIGDGLVDVKAGREAGCKTILVASANGFLLNLLAEQNAEPDYLVKTLEDAIRIVEGLSTQPATSDSMLDSGNRTRKDLEG